MQRFFKIAFGAIVWLCLTAISAARLAVELIGASTAQGDFDGFTKMIKSALDWLFGTPWPVAAFLLILIALLGAWLIYSGVKGAATEVSPDTSGSPNTKAKALQFSFRNEPPFIITEARSGGLTADISVCISNNGNGKLSNCMLKITSLSENLMFMPQELMYEAFSLTCGEKKYIRFMQWLSFRNKFRLNIPFFGTMDYDPFIHQKDYYLTLEASASESKSDKITLFVSPQADGSVLCKVIN